MIRAAGVVLWRERRPFELEIALVHRAKFDDWTFPKGKLDAGENFEQAAWREVWEETGFDCVLGAELQSVAYSDSQGRSKLVRYWAMQQKDPSMAFQPNDEVDQLQWHRLADAAALLTYEHDADLLESLNSVVP